MAEQGAQVMVVSDSESSLFAFLKLSTRAKLVHRGRIMRQASLILHHSDMQACLGFLHGIDNPADAPSRFAVPGNAPVVFDLNDNWLQLASKSFSLVCWRR